MSWHNLTISSPAYWGKLPCHADYVQHGVRAHEVQAWQEWLVKYLPQSIAGRGRNTHHHLNQKKFYWHSLEPERFQYSRFNVPVIFVLAPGVMPFAPKLHVVGVIANSQDRLGRKHPLIVYQQANRRWLRQQFVSTISPKKDGGDATKEEAVELQHPWLFWLARLVSRYVHAHDDFSYETEEAQPALHGTAVAADQEAQFSVTSMGLDQAMMRLWFLHRPGWKQWFGIGHRHPSSQQLQAIISGSIQRRFYEVAYDFKGVAYPPWIDWPDRLWHSDSRSNFWQQDSLGGYIGATETINELWRE